jgi:protein TonB
LRCIFDANGGVLNNLFQRALVKNPSIEGKIIFDLIILSSGKVAPQTSFSSSELKNEKLENDLLNAVKNFDFLPVLVSTDWHAKYPVTFYP